MSNLFDPGGERILAAALTLFARHGFQRASMADVAREAGIARATLYLRFADKRALFEALAASLVDQALADAQAAWDPAADLADAIAAVVLAKELRFFRMINATSHGAELLAVDADLTSRHVSRLNERYAALLTCCAQDAEAHEADLGAFDGAAGFARFIATAGAGLKYEVRAEAPYRDAIQRLARVAARAANPRKETIP